MIKKSTIVVVVILIVILLILGFSDKSEIDNKESIKIGVIGPLTGSNAWIGEFAIATLEVSKDKINKEGGINGRPIEFVMEDADNSQKATSAMNKLINQDQVTMVYAMTTPVVAASTPIADQNKIPMFGFTAVETFAEKSQYVFSDLRSVNKECPFLATIAKEQGMNKVAFLGNDADFSLACKESVKKAGMIFVAEETKFANDPNTKTQLLKIKNSGADSLLMMCWPPDCNIIYKQMVEMNFTPRLLLPITTSLPFNPLATAGIDKDAIFTGAFGTDQGVNPGKPTPAITEYLESYKNKTGKEMKYGGDPLVIYDNLQQIAIAMRKCPDLSKECIRDKMLETNYTGIAGHVEYKGKHNAERAIRGVRYVNGTWIDTGKTL